MWGGNRDGKLGSGVHKQSTVPSLVHFPDGFEASFGALEQVCCGTTHTMAITTSGTLFSWGSNRYGQLGRETNKKVCDSHPNVISSISNVVSADCGLFHAAAIDDSGCLFTWGLPHKGALGYNANSSQETPREVDYLNEPVANVQCGDYLTCCITSSTGEVFVSGCIDSKGSDYQQFDKMTKIPQVLAVTDVYCNKSRLALLIRNTDVLLQRHAIEGNVEPFQSLVKYLCSLNPKLRSSLHEIVTQDGNSLLHLACKFNQVKIVEYLLFHFPDYDTTLNNGEGLAAIHICAKLGNDECLKLLLLHPCTEVDQKDQALGNSALHFAVIQKSEAVARLLVLHGAEKSI